MARSRSQITSDQVEDICVTVLREQLHEGGVGLACLPCKVIAQYKVPFAKPKVGFGDLCHGILDNPPVTRRRVVPSFLLPHDDHVWVIPCSFLLGDANTCSSEAYAELRLAMAR